MRRPKFFCEYDELEYDSIENRVVLQAMTIVERTSKNSHIKMKSMNYAQRLSGVVQKENVRKPERQRMMHSYNRQNARYRQIHETCETIIERQGIDNIYSGEHSHVVPIFYDMDKEFERFVSNLFDKYYEGPGYVDTQIQEKAWKGEGLGSKGMKPDIIIREGREVKEIIDVKYKTKAVIEISELYQIGFYMHEYGKDNKDPDSIKRAFAIMPKYPGAKEGSYTATKTKKVVHVKRIDVNDWVKKIKAGGAGLGKIINSLIEE
jgi:5-methylcytosine-specific restriction endonuclease McrBC regulatory subunit McrC